MIALVIGATGATGKELVKAMDADPDFTEIHLFLRRDSSYTSPKIIQHKVNFDEPDSWAHLVKGDVAFSTLGTTLKDAGSKDAQWKIDYDYQYNFAKTARENGVWSFILVSAYGAKPNSPIFYSKLKGQLEEAVKKLHFPHTTIFKPGMLERENTQRVGEKIFLQGLKTLNKLGILKSQKPLHTRTLAQAMVNAAKIKSNGYAEISLGNIFSFAEKKH